MPANRSAVCIPPSALTPPSDGLVAQGIARSTSDAKKLRSVRVVEPVVMPSPSSEECLSPEPQHVDGFPTDCVPVFSLTSPDRVLNSFMSPVTSSSKQQQRNSISSLRDEFGSCSMQSSAGSFRIHGHLGSHVPTPPSFRRVTSTATSVASDGTILDYGTAAGLAEDFSDLRISAEFDSQTETCFGSDNDDDAVEAGLATPSGFSAPTLSPRSAAGEQPSVPTVEDLSISRSIPEAGGMTTPPRKQDKLREYRLALRSASKHSTSVKDRLRKNRNKR